MIPHHRLEQINQRFQFLEASMAAGAEAADIAALAKEYSDLKPVIEQITAYRQILTDMEDAEAMLDDPDMAELAQEELPKLKAALPDAEAALQLSLLPKDAADAKPAMLEIRPGTGGMKRPCLQPIYCVCINAIAKRMAGSSISSKSR